MRSSILRTLPSTTYWQGNRPRIGTAALPGERGLARHHPEPGRGLQARREILDQTVGEMRLCSVLAHVREGQDDDGAWNDLRRSRLRVRYRFAAAAHHVEAPGERERDGEAEQQQHRGEGDGPGRQVQRG
jgi:hypothetical protein